MSLDLDLFAVDQRKSDEGVWFTYDRSPGLKVKIRSIECDDYTRAVERMRSVHTRGMRPGSSLPEKTAAMITKRCVSDLLVVDWEGLKDKSGSQIPFSCDMCYEILSDDRYIDFYAWVLNQSTNIKNFEEEELDEAGKSSETGSDGG